MAFDFTHTNFRFVRPLSSYHKVQQAIGWAIRNKKIFATLPKHGAYIDVGSGPNMHDDFYNIDYSWRPGLDLCWDITRGLPFTEEFVGGIFTEHCVEHITYSDFLKLAGEFHRVLISGSTVRIIVPDGELYARNYLQKEAMPYGQDDMLSGIYTPFMSVNRIFYNHGHRFIYDFETLYAILARTGFRTIEKSAFRQGRDARLLIDTEGRAVESLYVEATK
jgi:predicted SAM-dependent methyltransferase